MCVEGGGGGLGGSGLLDRMPRINEGTRCCEWTSFLPLHHDGGGAWHRDDPSGDADPVARREAFLASVIPRPLPHSSTHTDSPNLSSR